MRNGIFAICFKSGFPLAKWNRLYGDVLLISSSADLAELQPGYTNCDGLVQLGSAPAYR